MDFACFQVWTFSEKHAKTISQNHEKWLQNSLKTAHILKKSVAGIAWDMTHFYDSIALYDLVLTAGLR